jgi:3',5'-cyclic-AMP phosphodiesterase
VKLIWLTDCHFQLDVRSHRRPFEQFVQAIAEEQPEAILLGGDLCNRASLGQLLTTFRKTVQVPTFAVLGNHEFMGSMVAAVRAQMAGFASMSREINWLSEASEPVWLQGETALIGADTWGDARAGNLSAHNLRRRGHQLLYDRIEDIRLIWESCGSDTTCIARKVQAFLQARGDEAANHLQRVGRIAAQSAKQVLILLHAPPFPEVTLHRGEPDPNGLPFFCAQAAGDAIKELAESFPNVAYTVLSGHTHHEADVQIRPNLRVLVHAPGGSGANSNWVILEMGSEEMTMQTNRPLSK